MSMNKIWHDHIMNSERTFEEVPKYRKDAVKNLFREDVADGIITKERYEELIGEPYEAVA